MKLKVLPTVTENKAPVAVIKPAGKVSFKLPAEFSLNGIDSHDDDKVPVITLFYFKIRLSIKFYDDFKGFILTL